MAQVPTPRRPCSAVLRPDGMPPPLRRMPHPDTIDLQQTGKERCSFRLRRGDKTLENPVATPSGWINNLKRTTVLFYQEPYQ